MELKEYALSPVSNRAAESVADTPMMAQTALQQETSVTTASPIEAFEDWLVKSPLPVKDLARQPRHRHALPHLPRPDGIESRRKP